MIRISIRLFGTLSRKVDAYDPQHGLEIELPNGATAADLLRNLDIGASEGGVVAVDGRVLKADAPLPDGGRVHILQMAHGG